MKTKKHLIKDLNSQKGEFCLRTIGEVLIDIRDILDKTILYAQLNKQEVKK